MFNLIVNLLNTVYLESILILKTEEFVYMNALVSVTTLFVLISQFIKEPRNVHTGFTV